MKKIASWFRSKKRTFFKTITWRAIAFANSTFLAWLFLGDMSRSLGYAVIYSATAFVLYFLHDLAWEKKKEALPFVERTDKPALRLVRFDPEPLSSSARPQA